MKRATWFSCLVMALAVLWGPGCAGKRSVAGSGAGEPAAGGAGDEAPATGGEPDPLQKVVALTWTVLEPDASGKRQLALTMTDETGASTFEVVEDEVQGTCTEGFGRDELEGVVIGIRCAADGTGAQFRVVWRQGQLIILRAPLYGDDEVSYEEHRRIAVPGGATVRAGS